MSKRTIRYTTAALALLALTAGYGTASAQSYNYNNQQGQSATDAWWQAIQNLQDSAPTFEECRDAYGSSQAYPYCQWDSIEPEGLNCVIVAVCRVPWNEYTASSTWKGSLEDTSKLVVCGDALLRTDPC